jgi:hypothetical protein
MHADVCEEAADHDRARAEPAQEDGQIGGEEGAVAPLAHKVGLVGAQLGHQRGACGSLQAVGGLVAVELATEVDPRGAVDLLGEDDRRATRLGGRHQVQDVGQRDVWCVGHGQEVDLGVDDQQRRPRGVDHEAAR